MTGRRRVQFAEPFWNSARSSFSSQRTGSGRPSIRDFEQVALEAIRFAFSAYEQLIEAEPGSPVVLAVLRPSPAFPAMAAYALVSREPDGTEVVDVVDLTVDWGEWELLRRAATEE